MYVHFNRSGMIAEHDGGLVTAVENRQLPNTIGTVDQP